MKTICSLTLGAALLAGCASPSSPLTPSPSSRVDGRTAVTMGLATAATAAAGAMIDKKHPVEGAAIGAVTGLLASAVVTNSQSDKEAELIAEAREQGRREERVAVMRRYWEEKTTSLKDDGASVTTNGKQVIQYPAGTYEGIRYAPRDTASPKLEDVPR